MSDWYVAETAHVLVYSRGQTDRLVTIAHNLEKLHFLLSILLNRVDEPDDKVKLRVTLFGDTPDFQKLHLGNTRWQQGPWPRDFPNAFYYDPREDGSVLALPYRDQLILLQPGWGKPSKHDRDPDDPTNAAPDVVDMNSISFGQIAFPMRAEGRIYAAYAQHYLMTYFPAAYPRWYLEGFGEIFATLESEEDGSITYGQQPEGYRRVNEKFGFYPVSSVIRGDYLDADPPRRPRFTPYRAWALAHLMFFSEQWQKPLHDYLAAVARGAKPSEAMKALGDIGQLQREYYAYHGRKVANERMTFPADRALAPIVRQLDRSEAAFVHGKLEMGARLEVPQEPGLARDQAVAERDAWLAGLRESGMRYPNDMELQLLVAEAECRSGNPGNCLAAAERALAAAPANPSALSWKGSALAQQALAGPASERAAALKTARGWIVKANRADPEAVLPLLAYYRSFADAGEPVPDAAVLGLLKVSERVPNSPAVQLMLGAELARLGDKAQAVKALRPLAIGAYDSPERPHAEQLLASLR